MYRFLHPNDLSVDQEVELSEQQSKHLSRVLRIKVGEEVFVMNGRGSIARCEVLRSSARSSAIRVLKVEKEEGGSRVCIAFGIPKTKAIDFIVRRCTEVGVGALQPLVTRHSERAQSWNADRWERVLAEVTKQCESVFFPTLLPPKPLQQWLIERESTRLLILCDEGARQDSISTSDSSVQADILVGPEGGWHESEVASIKQLGAVTLGLGKNRLRVETAALASLVLLNNLLGDR